MFVLRNLEKITETRLKFSQGSLIVVIKMLNHEEARFKRTNTQLGRKNLQEQH